MADISILSRLIAGVQRNVDLSQNALVVGSLKVGSSSPTELTKTILDNLVTLQGGGDAGALHHHDGAYFTETELGSSSASSGSDLIGDDATYSNFTPAAATVKGALSGIDTALANVADEKVGVSANDTTPGYLEDKIIVDNGTNSTNPLEASTLNDAGDEDLRIRFDQTKLSIASSQISDKGSANGIASLDANGKVPVSQLPNAIMEYQGVWDADTNSPTLADGVGNDDEAIGDVYRVSVAGTQDLGSGNITFAVGDYVILNASKVWEKADTTDAVSSVNSQTGEVVLDSDDIGEGSSNLYFTENRAKTAAVADSITDGITDVAPSQNAVFDALALKQDASAELDEAETFFASTDISAAEAEQLSDGSNADSLHSHSLMKLEATAGEAVAAETSFAVRYAVDGETLGRVYKASQDASSSDLFYVVGIAKSAGALSAGDGIEVTTHGLHTLGSSDAAFNAADIGKAVFLTTGGALTITAPTTANHAVVRVGVVATTTSIFVQPQVMGVN